MRNWRRKGEQKGHREKVRMIREDREKQMISSYTSKDIIYWR
jgi:hypothetical protein